MIREPLSCLLILVAALLHASAEDPAGVDGSSISEKELATIDGLAVYKIGKGKPVFLMPYPHASASMPMAESPLARLLVDSGHSVISFDAPGTFRSKRKPKVNMEEMLGCALETLGYFGIQEPIDMMGHSMSSFCALAFAVEHQARVKSLVLVGSTSGWPAVSRWGIHKHWPRGTWERRRLMWWGFRLFLGIGNMKIHKKLDHLINEASYVEKSHVSDLSLERGDALRRVPVRSKWPAYLRKSNIDYGDRLAELEIPVLVCVGRFDPQTPVEMNRELHDGIRDSRLVIFEQSGHSPFIEEPELFSGVIRSFRASCPGRRQENFP
jgi:proline iminopeptidase